MLSGHFIEKELERRIRERNLPAVKSIFKRIAPADRGWRNEKGESFLHIALAVCDQGIFNWLYSKMENNEVIFTLDQKNRSLIWLAAKRINPAFAVSLLARWIASDKFKSHPNRHVWLNVDSHLVSILHIAAADSSSEALEFLLQMLAENAQWAGVMDQQDDEGKTPLHHASEAKAFDNIVLLVNAGADLFMSNKQTEYFLDWFEENDAINEKIDLFKRFNQQKQLQILSYFRSRKEETEWFVKLLAVRTAQFPEENIEEELNRFDRSNLKSATHVFVEDVQWLHGLVSKVDTLAADLKARPVPNNNGNRKLALFFSNAFPVLGGSIFIMPFFVILALAFISVIFAVPVTFGFLLMAVYLTVGIVCVLAMGSYLLGKHFASKQPQVKISHDELTEITHELDVGLVQKCKTLKETQGIGMLPVSLVRVLLLEDFLEQFKSGTATEFVLQGVVTALDRLKTNLLAFRDDMLQTKRPFSRIVAAEPPLELESEPVLVPKVAVLPSVANHWASLHAVVVDPSPVETLSVSAGVTHTMSK